MKIGLRTYEHALERERASGRERGGGEAEICSG
jgi:hypothetical protein